MLAERMKLYLVGVILAVKDEGSQGLAHGVLRGGNVLDNAG